MSSESVFAGLSPDDRYRVDRICDEFERAWQGRSPPAIGDFVAGAS